MRIQGPCTLKRCQGDTSDAIILTFDSRWREPIVSAQVRVVFRKMGPSDFTPNLMYIYIAAPDSAIVARSPITKYETLNLADALLLADDGKISRDALTEYARDRRQLIVMHLGEIAIAQSQITYLRLAEDFNFWPSSTFIPLSESGRRVLDKLGTFAVRS